MKQTISIEKKSIERIGWQKGINISKLVQMRPKLNLT